MSSLLFPFQIKEYKITRYAIRPTGFAAGLLFCVSGVKIFPESGRSEH